MNARIDRDCVLRFLAGIVRLRPIMFAQGIMWLIAGASLFMTPNTKIVNVILMSILGVLFIGWGYSIDRQKWLSNPRITKVDLELNAE